MVATLSWLARIPRKFLPAGFVLLLVMLGGGTRAHGRGSSDLDLDPDHAPYRVKIVKTMECLRTNNDMTSYLMADLEGDGHLELVEGSKGRLLGWDCEDGYIKPRFRINLDPGWKFHHHSGTRLGVVSDLNDDRVAAVHVTLVADDRSAWRYQAVDLATGKMLVDRLLPLGVDRRADGVWDGSYIPIGTITDADGQGTPGVVLLRNAGYDANPRGVIVLNAGTGETMWEWHCGPNPDTQTPAVVDLDGDGNEEIVLFGNSPDNLGGQLINGTSDDHSYLFVLSPFGEELWREELGGVFNAGGLLVADLNDDGKPEIVTYTAIGLTGQTNRLIIWDYANRRPIVAQRQEAMFRGVAATPGPVAGSSWLYTGSNDGFITRYLFASQKLTREVRTLAAEPACAVIGTVDILPEPGLEVLAVVGRDQTLAVLDRELQPLAVFVDRDAYPKESPVVWERTDKSRSLVVGGQKAYYVLDFVHLPHPVPAAVKIAGAVVLLLGLLGGAFLLGRGQRHKKAAGELRLPQVADREVLFRMWRQLDDVKHERFLEANRGLRRLVWLLEAYAADLGASETLSLRIGQLLDDFNDSIQPRLLEVLHLARLENFETEAAQRAALALEKLGNHLGNLDVETLTQESVQAHGTEMKEALGQVEEGFLHLWQSLRRYFSTDPVRMLQGMLLVREVEFQRAGVETRLLGADQVADPVCLIDSSSLRFILDNLVDNALRAMGDSSVRILTVTVQRSKAELTLEFSDTGFGIAPERQDRIFNGRTSDRVGGGAGLFRTREILQKWRGEILLSESAPGQGTTFVVKLRAATKIETATGTPQAFTGEA